MLNPTQLDSDAVVVFGEARFGKLQFQLSEHLDRGQDCARLLTDVAGHGEQYAMNLSQLFVEQAYQFVILLDRFQRLDEHGLAAGTCAMHHALHAAFLFNFHGDNKALAADGYQFVLHGAALGQLAQISAQRLLNLAPLLFDVAANSRQFGRSAIFQRAIGLNFVAKESQELGEVGYCFRERPGAAPIGSHVGGRMQRNLTPLGGAVDEQHNIADIRGFEHGSTDARLLNQFRDVEERGKIEASAHAAKLTHLPG